jgi:hypothetical protein
MRGVWGRDPQGAYDPQAVLATPVEHPPRQILPYFVRRGRLEVTCEAARAHLGMATQRPWTDVARARTPPGLVGVFSVVAVLADGLRTRQIMPVCRAAWYTKAQPTCAEAMALTRRCVWKSCHFSTSRHRSDV